MKAGAVIRRIRDNTSQNTNLRGSYTFNTFNALLAGQPASFQAVQVGEDAYRGLRQTMAAVYGQDDINLTSRVTLNIGLRWDAVTDPTEANGKMSNLLHPLDPQLTVLGRFFDIGKKTFEPRAGFAWRLNERGTTVLRAGGGVFHNHTLPVVYALQVNKLPPFYNLFIANNPTFPDGYTALIAGGLARLIIINPTVKELAKDQYNVSIEQQMFKDMVIEVAYVGSKANHVYRFRESNTPVPVTLPDGQKFFPVGAPRANPVFDSIRVMTSDTNAIFNGLTITVKKKSSTGLQYQAFYTYSKAMDAISGVATGDQSRDAATSLDPTNWKRDWGPSVFDARHNFVFNFTYPLPFRFSSRMVTAALGGWNLKSIGTFTAGQPFTPHLATNNSRNGDILAPDRPNLKPGANDNPVLGGPDRYYDPSVFALPLPGTYGNLGRNTIIGPGVANLDLSIEKNFKVRESKELQFRAELFNVMNHPNFDLPNTSALTAAGAPNSSAGRVTRTVTTSRQIQFGLKLNF